MSYRDRVRAMGRDAAEYFVERAAVAEYDGGLSREHAEQAAYIQTVRRFGASKESTR